jgi:hypothetical protein
VTARLSGRSRPPRRRCRGGPHVLLQLLRGRSRWWCRRSAAPRPEDPAPLEPFGHLDAPVRAGAVQQDAPRGRSPAARPRACSGRTRAPRPAPPGWCRGGARAARPRGAPPPPGSRRRRRRHQLGVRLLARAQPAARRQAPYGELKENWRGSSSGMLTPQRGRRSARRRRAAPRRRPPWTSTSTTPSAVRSAVSTESASRCRSSGAPPAGPPPRRCRGSGGGRARAGLQLDQLAVHPGAHEPLPRHLLEQVAELALAAAHQRGEHLDPRPLRASRGSGRRSASRSAAARVAAGPGSAGCPPAPRAGAGSRRPR